MSEALVTQFGAPDAPYCDPTTARGLECRGTHGAPGQARQGHLAEYATVAVKRGHGGRCQVGG